MLVFHLVSITTYRIVNTYVISYIKRRKRKDKRREGKGLLRTN